MVKDMRSETCVDISEMPVSVGSLSPAQAGSSVEGLRALVQELQGQVSGLERALHTREVTGTAVGLLAAWLKIDTVSAWHVICRVSNDTNVRVVEVSRLLVASANGPVADLDDLALLRQVADAIDTAAHHRADTARD